MLSCLGLYREYVSELSMLKRKSLHSDQTSEMPAVTRLTLEEVLKTIQTKKAVIVIGKGQNASVQQAVGIFRHEQVQCEIIDLEKAGDGRANIERALFQLTCRKSTPLIFVKGDCVGNVNDFAVLNSKKGVLKEYLKDHAYDLIVIGGGSGGLAAAQEAASLGKKVAVLDYVVPTPQGTTWGLGGTCVNVGCIPKKLMHQAAVLGHNLQDAKKFGWQFDEKVTHDWATMRDAVQAHISSLNWGSKVALREKNIKYLNSYGKFVGSHTVVATDKSGAEETLTGDRFLIATGLRPRYLDNCPGAKEYCITSDDLFKLPYSPGKTLVVGASYVALECAGFLNGTGFDVTVMVRSILLRGFDLDMADRIGKHMEEVAGVRFIREKVPTKIELIEDGKPRKLRVTSQSTDGKGETIVEEYNTVLLGIGRDAITDHMGLDVAHVQRNEKNKKIICHKNEQSVSAPFVYAVGDVLDGGIELTPVAIQAGRMLVRRMFGGAVELCDYTNVPTTVFTPLEYGCCGLSEEVAKEKFKDDMEVYHIQFTPLEYTVPHRKESEHCYAKMICNKKDDLRVVGFHILGPNAGEVTQGFAIGLKLNAKKADFDRLVGIHPTVAELFTTLKVTKASKLDAKGEKC